MTRNVRGARAGGKCEARYHDVAAAPGGMSSSTVAETRRALVATRLVDRHHTDGRPEATYSLTR